MIVLTTDPFDHSLSADLTTAVHSAGLLVTIVDLGSDPDAINRFRLGCVPCLARIHDGFALYCTQEPADVATFKADAQAAVDAYEAAKQEPGP